MCPRIPFYIHLWSEAIATLTLFGPIEEQKWFDQISSQKNRFAFISFGKIQFLPPCIWNLPFMSYRLWGAPFRQKKAKSLYPDAHRGTEYIRVER